MTNGPITMNYGSIRFSLRYVVSELQGDFQTDASLLKLSDPNDFCREIPTLLSTFCQGIQCMNIFFVISKLMSKTLKIYIQATDLKNCSQRDCPQKVSETESLETFPPNAHVLKELTKLYTKKK